MKKLFLPTIFFIFLLLVNSSNAYAQSSDCWKEYSDIKPICDQAITEQNLLEKCDQASNIFHQCLGVDKNPWKLKSSKPGHLSCKEWKNLSIVGTAQNCVAPVTELFEKKLWCLNSAAEISQVRSHPVDYILDFDPYSCILTEDDVRQFKAGLPLTSESSLEVSQKTANGGAQQETPSPFNIFGANPFQTWLNLKGLSEIAAYIGTDAVIKDAEYLFSSIERAQQKQEAESNELFEELKFVQEASARFGELRLQDKIRAGEIVKKYDARVEATNQPVLIKMDSGTLELHPLNGQTGVIEPGSYWPILHSGALDVIVEPQIDQQFKVQTPNMDLFVIGTEFSVIYNPKKDQTLIAVYKGQVEIKTKTGQKAIVSPNGDKPRVVLVSQKLSPIKLAIGGLILILIVVGVVLVIKKKLTAKGSGKRKRN